MRPGPALTPAQNEQSLSPETEGELLTWGTRLVRCLGGQGVAFGQPQIGNKEVLIRIRVSARLTEDPMAFVTRLNRCDRRLGAPPREAAVTIDRGAIQRGRGAIRLYKPRTCPLSASPMKAPQ